MSPARLSLIRAELAQLWGQAARWRTRPVRIRPCALDRTEPWARMLGDETTAKVQVVAGISVFWGRSS